MNDSQNSNEVSKAFWSQNKEITIVLIIFTLSLSMYSVGYSVIVALFSLLILKSSFDKIKLKQKDQKEKEIREKRERIAFLNSQLLVAELEEMIKKHESALLMERRRLVRVDAYGNTFPEKWYTEGVSYFYSHVVEQNVTWELKPYLSVELCREKIIELIDSQAAAKSSYGTDSVENLTGEEYELLCKEILQKKGWSVATTKASGDQGVDLIASKAGVKVAIQCKRYSGTVGNSAVQEVVSGKAHYGLQYGVVVTNSTYTRSAEELARSTNIRLLHHNDLERDNFYL